MNELTEARQSEIRASCERHRVERLSLFGSALREDFDPARSDLDFAVEFSITMTPGEHADAYFGPLEDLEDLFDSREDLVEIEAVRNPYLRRGSRPSKRPSMPRRSQSRIKEGKGVAGTGNTRST